MRFILWLSTTDMIQLIVLSVGGILLTNNIFYEKILYPLFVTYIISHFSPRNKPNKKNREAMPPKILHFIYLSANTEILFRL